MIPYFNVSILHLGPLTIHTWGFVVSIGFGVALWVAYSKARRVGLDGNALLDMGFWILVGAFLGARLFHVFFYEWGYYQAHLNEIVRIDQGGLSSFGGFIGSAVMFLVYGNKRRLNLWHYADVLMFAWPLGHAIGRVGCFLTHMHPGRLSNVAWAVQYPGGVRLDMGLMESVVLLSYWVALIIFSRRGLPSPGLWRPPSPRGRGEGEGRYLASGMMFYGIMRFTFDFFRATDLPMSDARSFGLTPAQYGSVVLFVCGLITWQRLHRRANVV